MPIHNDDLDRLLRAPDVPPTRPDTLDQVARAARDLGLRQRRGRLMGSAITVVVGLCLALVAAPATAEVVRQFLALTEWEPDAEAPQLPGSEFVDLGAPDLADYIESIYPDWLPLAPGQTREQLIAETAAGYARVEGPGESFTQELYIRARLEDLAYCGWIDLWVTDPASRSDAAAVIAERSTWPATAARADAPALVLFDAVAVAATDGDREGVLAGAQAFECTSWDGTDRTPWLTNHGVAR
jgi:hypothetical protein